MLIVSSFRIPMARAQEPDYCDAGEWFPYTFSQDGKYILGQWATRNPDNEFQKAYIIWETATRRVIHFHEVVDMDGGAISPDNSLFAIADSSEREVTIFDFKTGNKISQLKFDAYLSQNLYFLPDNKRILTIDLSSSQAILWDIKTAKQLHAFVGNNPLMVLSNDRKYLLMDTRDQLTRLSLWNIDTGEKLKSFSDNGYLDAAISLDDRLVGVSDDTTLVIWDIQAGTSQSIIFPNDAPGYQKRRQVTGFSPDNKYAVMWVEVWVEGRLLGGSSSDLGYLYSTVEVWDLQQKKIAWEWDRQAYIMAVMFPDSDHMLVGMLFKLQMWNLKTKTVEKEGAVDRDGYWNEELPQRQFVLSPDGRLLLTAHYYYHYDIPYDSTSPSRYYIDLWDMKTGQHWPLCNEPKNIPVSI
jgi:WD40 repeat protein